MTKTFVPQYIRLLRKLAAYTAKHRSTMTQYTTSAQQATFDQIKAASAVFDGINIEEGP